MGVFEERQERENKRQYEKWLSCGFRGNMEIDKNGWCVNGLSFYKEENIERKILFDKAHFIGRIEFMELPNGNWISGSSCTFPLHGWGHGLSVWNKQYETKEEAVTKELDYIENSLEERDKKKFVLDAIQTCRNEFKEATFKTVFEPSAQFEQIDLF